MSVIQKKDSSGLIKILTLSEDFKQCNKVTNKYKYWMFRIPLQLYYQH